MSDTLKFHTYSVDETKYRAAWGARLISQPEHMPYVPIRGGDLLPDRQDCVGSEDDQRRLIDLLNERLPRDVMNKRIAEAGLYVTEDRAVVIYDDGEVEVTINPQGSYGYLYVTAVLKGG